MSAGQLGIARATVRSLAPFVAGLGLALVLHFIVVPGIGPFWARVLMTIGINVILAVSLTIVNGFTGQFSIGHAGFMAVGGYFAGAITYYSSLAVWGANSVAGGRLS